MMTHMLFFTYFLIVCVILIFWVFSTSTFNHWKKLGVFHLKPTPFFGNILSLLLMRQSVHEMLDKLYKDMDKLPYGGYFEMRTPILVIKDPVLIQRILVTDFKYFHSRGFSFLYLNKQLNPLNESILNFSGQRWKNIRQKMNPVFTTRKLKGMQKEILNCLSVLINHIETNMTDDGKDVNLNDLFLGYTIDVIGSCAFGIECNATENKNEFRKHAEDFLKPRLIMMLKLFLGVFNEKLLEVFHITDFPSHSVKFFQNLVYDAVLHRRKNNLQCNDLLQQLMDMQSEAIDLRFSSNYLGKSTSKEDSFDEVNIAANAFIFFGAGFETTSLTLTHCLYELALNQKVQDRLRAEVFHIYQKNGDQIDFECLREMTYMNAVIAETLRKYPPLPLAYRQCVEDYVVPETGLMLKQGDRVQIPIWSLHHDSRYYPNPDLFDPERFNDENKESHLPGTYLPFGDGPRYCIGKRFSETVMKLTISKMLMLYHLNHCSKTDIPFTYENSLFTLKAKDGVVIKILRRK